MANSKTRLLGYLPGPHRARLPHPAVIVALFEYSAAVPGRHVGRAVLCFCSGCAVPVDFFVVDQYLNYADMRCSRCGSMFSTTLDALCLMLGEGPAK